MSNKYLIMQGARQNNLKNINLEDHAQRGFFRFKSGDEIYTIPGELTERLRDAECYTKGWLVPLLFTGALHEHCNSAIH